MAGDRAQIEALEEYDRLFKAATERSADCGYMLGGRCGNSGGAAFGEFRCRTCPKWINKAYYTDRPPPMTNDQNRDGRDAELTNRYVVGGQLKSIVMTAKTWEDAAENFLAAQRAEHELAMQAVREERDRANIALHLALITRKVAEADLAAAIQRAERAEAERDETFTDEKGEVWRRPTAWAYFAACRALEQEKDRATRAALAKPDAEGGERG